VSAGSRHGGICSLADFDDDDFVRMAHELAPDLASRPPHRKLWERVKGALFLRDCGILDGDSKVLDVGAGTEPVLFWLAACPSGGGG
jgi:hypothetical protein